MNQPPLAIQNENEFIEEEEEDATSWIPMNQGTNSSSRTVPQSCTTATSVVIARSPPIATSSSSSLSARRSSQRSIPSNHTPRNRTPRSSSNHHGRRNPPTTTASEFYPSCHHDKNWSQIFFFHFITELWRNAHVKIGLGLILLGVSMNCLAFGLGLWNWIWGMVVSDGGTKEYVLVLVGCVILLYGSIQYLFANGTGSDGVMERMQHFFSSVVSSLEDFCYYILSSLFQNPFDHDNNYHSNSSEDAIQQLRNACMIVSLLPTLLEVNGLLFLSNLIHDRNNYNNNNNNAAVMTVLVSVAMGIYIRLFVVTLSTKRQQKKEEDPIIAIAVTSNESHKARILLHVTAIFVTICCYSPQDDDTNTSHYHYTFHRLIGPLLISMGTFLASTWSSSSKAEKEEWINVSAQNALKVTLGEMLITVGENVQEEEMLQLVMLRWLVDYWAHHHHPHGGGPQPPPQEGGGGEPSSASYGGGANTESSSDGFGWEEMSSMLDMTTDQMMHEVATHEVVAAPNLDTRRSTRSANYHSAASHENTGNTIRPSTTSEGLASVPSSSTSSTTAGHSSRTSTSNKTTNTSTNNNNTNDENNQSITNLKSMLAHLSTSPSSHQAIKTYKKSVYSMCPPNKSMALIFTLSKRCPACVSIVLSMTLLAVGKSAMGVIMGVMGLMPLVVLEIMRVWNWIGCCQDRFETTIYTNSEDSRHKDTTLLTPTTLTNRNNTKTIFFDLPEKMDTMSILLLPESFSPTSTHSLLQVWTNIQNSVYALETGMTIIQTAHTTSLTIDVMSDVYTVSQLGVEVYRHGWWHGVGILAKELLVFHDSSSSSSSSGESGGEDNHGYYGNAAVNAVRNGQEVMRNLQMYQDESESGNGFHPVVWFWNDVVCRTVGNVVNGSADASKDDDNNGDNEDRGQADGGEQDITDNETNTSTTSSGKDVKSSTNNDQNHHDATNEKEEMEQQRNDLDYVQTTFSSSSSSTFASVSNQKDNTTSEKQTQTTIATFNPSTTTTNTTTCAKLMSEKQISTTSNAKSTQHNIAVVAAAATTSSTATPPITIGSRKRDRDNEHDPPSPTVVRCIVPETNHAQFDDITDANNDPAVDPNPNNNNDTFDIHIEVRETINHVIETAINNASSSTKTPPPRITNQPIPFQPHLDETNDETIIEPDDNDDDTGKNITTAKHETHNDDVVSTQPQQENVDNDNNNSKQPKNGDNQKGLATAAAAEIVTTTTTTIVAMQQSNVKSAITTTTTPALVQPCDTEGTIEIQKSLQLDDGVEETTNIKKKNGKSFTAPQEEEEVQTLNTGVRATAPAPAIVKSSSKQVNDEGKREERDGFSPPKTTTTMKAAGEEAKEAVAAASLESHSISPDTTTTNTTNAIASSVSTLPTVTTATLGTASTNMDEHSQEDSCSSHALPSNTSTTHQETTRAPQTQNNKNVAILEHITDNYYSSKGGDDQKTTTTTTDTITITTKEQRISIFSDTYVDDASSSRKKEHSVLPANDDDNNDDNQKVMVVRDTEQECILLLSSSSSSSSCCCSLDVMEHDTMMEEEERTLRVENEDGVPPVDTNNGNIEEDQDGWTYISNDSLDNPNNNANVYNDDDDDNWNELPTDIHTQTNTATTSKIVNTAVVSTILPNDNTNNNNNNNDMTHSMVTVARAASQLRDFVHVQPQQQGTQSRRSGSNGETNEEQEKDKAVDWGKLVGGGLAVMGAAVVGAVALATKQPNVEQQQQRQHGTPQQHQQDQVVEESTSSVYIEEITDEDENENMDGVANVND